jgi:hypothetical protein
MREGEGFGHGTYPVWIDWSDQIWSFFHAIKSVCFLVNYRRYLINLAMQIALFWDGLIVCRL